MSGKKLLRILTVLAGPASVLGTGSARADWALNLTEGATPMSRQIFDLHMLVLWIVTVVGIAVFSVMVYSIIKHRKSKGAKAAQFHEKTSAEIIWTTIPFLILVAIAVPATQTLLAIEDTSDSDMTIQVTGYQWKWKYDYLGEDVSFFSSLAQDSRDAIEGDPHAADHYLLNVDNPLVVPTKKKIRFLVTANDVIHAWWVPALGFKQDAIPGFINDAWAYIDEPGTYRGQCAELCGKDHAFMPIVVEAKNEEDYKSWLAEQKVAAAEAAASAERDWTMEELMAKGEQVYQSSCAACHQPNGAGLPPAFPAITASPVATGPVEAHIDVVMHGVAGTAMQAFAGQLNDADLAAVITFERNGLGNNAGDMVQPSAIKAARK
jgi:cytochrome c oxidase subunit 2